MIVGEVNNVCPYATRPFLSSETTIQAFFTRVIHSPTGVPPTMCSGLGTERGHISSACITVPLDTLAASILLFCYTVLVLLLP